MVPRQERSIDNKKNGVATKRKVRWWIIFGGMAGILGFLAQIIQGADHRLIHVSLIFAFVSAVIFSNTLRIHLNNNNSKARDSWFVFWAITLFSLAVCATISFWSLKHSEPSQTDLKDDLTTLINSIKKNATYEQTEGKTNLLDKGYSGFSVDVLLRLGKPIKGRNNFIFDAGESLDKNRFSVFLDPEQHLCCRIINQNSKPIFAKAYPPLNPFDFGNLLYLICEYGSDERFSFVRIIVNGRQVAEAHQELSAPVTKLIISYGGCFGADLKGTNGGVFNALLFAAGHQTRSRQDIISLSDILAKFRDDLKGNNESGRSFDGTSYGRIEGKIGSSRP